MFPAYFTLVGSCCAISLSVFGYLHPWKSSSAVEKYQLGFLLSAFAFNLTNLFVFTPMTIDMMKQRHKVERENNIGDEVGWSKNREKAKIPRIHLSPEIPLSKEYEGRRLKVDYAKTKKKKTYAPREKPTPFAFDLGPSLALAGNLAEMRRDHDGSPPENTKRDVEEDRDFRRKSSREKPSGAGKDSGEEKDVSRRRESKKRTKDGKESGSESGLESGSESESDKEEERRRSRKTRGKRKSDRKSRRRRRDYSSSSSDSESESDYSSEYSDSEESESEDDRRRRKRKRREREERERKRRKREKDKKKTKKSDKDGDRKRKEKKKKKKSEKVKKGAVTESWGKYGIIRETDMWNKRPEFTAWLLEVKEVNLESLPPWEEKKMFKDFMEDHNTGTFTSKKYYDIDGYYRRKLEKEMKKGLKKAGISERTVFNDEEQRRLEMQELRERQKEEEVLALKRSMEGGMAQAMKEQARLKEEMVYLYKIGDMEGAAAIQRRLDPDVPM